MFQSQEDEPSNKSSNSQASNKQRPTKRPKKSIDKNELFTVKDGLLPFGTPISKNNPQTNKPDLYFNGITKWAGLVDNVLLEPAKTNSGIRSNDLRSLQQTHIKK